MGRLTRLHAGPCYHDRMRVDPSLAGHIAPRYDATTVPYGLLVKHLAVSVCPPH